MKKHIKFSAWVSLLMGVGISIGMLLILLIVFSGVSAKVGISDKMSGVILGLLLAISWFVGAFIVGITRKQKGLIWGAVHAGCMFILILLVSFIVNGAHTSVLNLKSLLYLLLGGLVSGFGCILGVHFALKRR